MTTTLSQNPNADQPGTPVCPESSETVRQHQPHVLDRDDLRNWRSKCPGSRSATGRFPPETSDTIGRLWRHAIGELIAPAALVI